MKKSYSGAHITSIDELRNEDILKKARMSKNANVGAITINHLSPIRIENNFKDIQQVNNNRVNSVEQPR